MEYIKMLMSGIIQQSLEAGNYKKPSGGLRNGPLLDGVHPSIHQVRGEAEEENTLMMIVVVVFALPYKANS